MKSKIKTYILFLFIIIISGLQGIPVQAIESTGQGTTSGVSISLKVDSNDILVNGESKKLESAPFLKNGIAYVPLKEIVDLCGGMVQYFPTRQSVVVALKDNKYVNFAEIWINKAKIVRPDENWEESSMTQYVFPVNKHYIPILKNDHVFVPADYFTRVGYAEVTWNPERKRIIISAGGELYIGEFKIINDFALLSEDTKERFKNTGRINYECDGYKEEIYSDGDMEIVLATYPNDSSKKDVLEIRKITLLTDKYSTPRGLKVGDSVERYMDLYGEDYYNDLINFEKNNGKITKITVKTYG